MIRQASRNAEEELDRHLAETSTQARTMRALAETVRAGRAARADRGLRQQPRHGHQRGRRDDRRRAGGLPQEPAIASSTSSAPETAPGDDFAMMREVLGRRFARLEKEDPDRSRGEWPDLLLIDGGKGQLSAVCETLECAGIHDVPVVGDLQGPRPQRRPRDLPPARRPRLPASAQLAGPLLPPAPARRGPPLRHRRPPRRSAPRA